MTEHTTCVIAGGGPAGMVLGLLLARGGVDVTVLEKHGDFLRDFRGDTVHPSTLRLLDELGLGERFAALPHSRVDEVALPDVHGDRVVFADLTRLRAPYPYIAMVPQWDLLNLLAEAAEQEPHFTLRMNTEVTGLTRRGGVVTGVRYRDRDGGGGEKELRADLTVGADGRGSTVRAASGLRPHETKVPFDAWWLRLPRRPDDGIEALGAGAAPGHMAVVIPREGYYQIAFLIPKGSDAERRAQGVGRFQERLAECLPALADRVDALTSMDDVKFLDVRLDRLYHWHLPGLLCIGDAAHSMSPAGGVGINLAVQDAVAAAEILAAPLRGGHPSVRDLARVRRRRWPATVLVQGVQRLMHRNVIAPVLERRRTGPPEAMTALVKRFPQLGVVPAYVIGVGVRPEHAPEFARRP
ncbi:2-polyprenyl-6-methoxyphenol hydroxylase-like FAD-dependent oxidoreductase [Nocardiopsis sp. Huas11]|uniref:FAD-dependent oxidoreductase n=1 Tax=Nocardiopsis sp. Huas11 TaxID=2183912 RepID=UPI000EAE3663|nr:FAD-dependent oxidoreductase [Nocardiopsis sp. Huas11]RKS09076.1 2-polyprenyl-6-methoxyphenol hydroxylase-like FAD-dependent oxidoreductase [Nocardiopsis sp. Huas11]